mmetsp:Transcript_11185/g.18439  ORF Transcript_11185/g.18439 Transcript_11185/m.18439 type:complete len:83 (+) Transcript_11185:228-476(+)
MLLWQTSLLPKIAVWAENNNVVMVNNKKVVPYASIITIVVEEYYMPRSFLLSLRCIRNLREKNRIEQSLWMMMFLCPPNVKC